MKTGIFSLTDSDRSALAEHLLALDGEDRYFRFFCRMTDSMIQSLVQRQPMDGIYGYWIAGELAAVAFVMPAEEDSVEFAVSVGKQWRGHGLAKLLLQHSLSSNEADHASEMVIHHLSDNVAMAAVSRQVPSQKHRAGPEVDVTIDLAHLRAEQLRAHELLCAAEAP